MNKEFKVSSKRDLKSCPFCGHDPVVYEEYPYDHENQMEMDWMDTLYGIRCDNCHIADTGTYMVLMDAIIIWEIRNEVPA